MDSLLIRRLGNYRQSKRKQPPRPMQPKKKRVFSQNEKMNIMGVAAIPSESEEGEISASPVELSTSDDESESEDTHHLIQNKRKKKFARGYPKKGKKRKF